MKVVLALLAASLLMAGCTKSSGEGSVPEQDAEGRYVVHMTAAQQFTPRDAKVPVGATVRWTNDGGVHDATALDGSWRSPSYMSAGATYDHTFTAEGEYEYHCTLHDGTTGTIHVAGEGPTGGASTQTSTSATLTASVTLTPTASA